MSGLKAVIFDLDDTIYPEFNYVKSGFKAVAAWVEKHMGVAEDEVFRELLDLFAEGKRGNIFDIWVDSRGGSVEYWVPEMVKVYRNHDPKIRPFEDFLKIIPKLRSKYKLGVLTDGYSSVQRRKLEALGIEHYFDVVVFSDDLGKDNWKPSVVPFKVILRELDVSGCESVYVADNPLKDFLGARKVNMWTVRFKSAVGLYSQIKPPSSEYDPHTEICSLSELPKALSQIESFLSLIRRR